MALLAKWLWRFADEENSLWRFIIVRRYGMDDNGWDCSRNLPLHSLMWKHISQIGPFFPLTRFVIGDGKIIKFWTDLWWGDATLCLTYPRLFRITFHKDAVVADILFFNEFGLSWNLSFSKDLYEWEVALVGSLANDLRLVFFSNMERGSRVWIPAFDGLFSSKSFFSNLSGLHSSSPNFSMSKVWKLAPPPRVGAFLWIISLGKQSTMDVLQRRRPYMALSPSVCCLCHISEESGNHIFIHCLFSYGIWSYFMQGLSLCFVMPESFCEILCQWGVGVFGQRGCMFFLTLLHGIVWGIWKERNRIIFEDKKINLGKVIDAILSEVGSWLLVKKEFVDFSLNDFIQNWNLCISVFTGQGSLGQPPWVPPIRGKFKVNFDGTSFGNPGPAGFGCVVRNHQGSIILAKGDPIGNADAIEVEMIGFLAAFRILKEKNWFKCFVEGDSKTVISWGSGKSKGSWRLNHLICKAKCIVGD